MVRVQQFCFFVQSLLIGLKTAFGFGIVAQRVDRRNFFFYISKELLYAGSSMPAASNIYFDK